MEYKSETKKSCLVLIFRLHEIIDKINILMN